MGRKRDLITMIGMGRLSNSMLTAEESVKGLHRKTVAELEEIHRTESAKRDAADERVARIRDAEKLVERWFMESEYHALAKACFALTQARPEGYEAEEDRTRGGGDPGEIKTMRDYDAALGHAIAGAFASHEGLDADEGAEWLLDALAAAGYERKK